MGKAHGRKRRLKKKYNFKVDRKKQWKKTKSLPKILCPQIKEAWDDQKSVYNNLKNMGLSADPNRTLRIPTTKEVLMASGNKEDTPKAKKKKRPHKAHVAEELEAEATAPQLSRFRLPKEEVNFAVYMMEKYGEDYKAMARDRRNYYQLTPKQIKQKIHNFQSVPEQYSDYLQSKVTTLSS